MNCLECGAVADGSAKAWRAYWAYEEGEEPHLVFYCPSCAEREFGWRDEEELS